MCILTSLILFTLVLAMKVIVLKGALLPVYIQCHWAIVYSIRSILSSPLVSHPPDLVLLLCIHIVHDVLPQH